MKVMIKVMLSIFITSISSTSFGNVLGTWQFDHDRTVEFNKESSLYTPEVITSLKCAENRLLVINNDRTTISTKEHVCLMQEGMELEFKAHTINIEHKKIFESPSMTIFIDSDGDAAIFYQVNENLIWKYEGGADDNIHLRNYFTRIK